MRFRGITKLSVDAKGRVAVPKAHRDRLQKDGIRELVVTADPSRCLLVYPTPIWHEIEEKLITIPNSSPQARMFQRLYVGYATDIELDSTGRILLPTELREYAGIDRKAVLIGQGKKFELWDERTWEHQRFAGEARFTCVQCNFGEMESAVNSLGWKGQVNGVLMDLGVSSPQLDVATRGFSFSQDAPLDMRMDPSSGQSAAQWLASVDEESLAHVLKTHGDERYARRIAKAIVLARADTPITRTAQLAEIIKAAHPRWERHHHPATRSFQAIRIEVNRELESISQALGVVACR